jgi:hypothetical protein
MAGARSNRRARDSGVLADFNASEYVVAAADGARLRVHTHPAPLLAVGDALAIEVDAQRCSVFRRAEG